MRRKQLARIASYGLFWILMTSPSWAGEVVTEEIKSWAREVVENEEALEAVTVANTVGVLYFRNQTEQSTLGLLQKGMALMLITDLSKIRDLQVVERVKIQALVQEVGLGTSGLVDPQTAPRVGKLLGAQWLVGGEISESGPKVLGIRSDLLDVPQEVMIGHPEAQGRLADIFRMEKDILFELTSLLKIVLTPEEEKELKKPMTTNVRALLDLVRAIDASDRGAYRNAAQFYQRALKEDPGLGGAEDSLQELDTLGLAVPTAGPSDTSQSLRDRTSLTDDIRPPDETKREENPVTGGIRVRW